MAKELTDSQIDMLLNSTSALQNATKKPRGVSKTETSPGDNRRFLQMALESRGLPKLDIHNPDSVQERINWYFERCASNDLKPTVSGLANSLGVSRQTLVVYKNDPPKNLPAEVREIILSAYNLMEELWEDYMQNGKINPVSGIFLGKNNYGYTDKQEVVLTPNNPLGEMENPDDLRDKYIEAIVLDN